MNNLSNKKVLICVTGSIAAYKVCDFIRALRKLEIHVKVIMTESAQKFIGVLTLAALSDNEVVTEQFPDNPKPGLEHIDFAIDYHAVVVIPATANIICKAANGVADDLISTTLSICEQPTIFVPAMNYRMWQNAATIEAVQRLKKREKIIIDPEEGQLASLHSGEGRLARLDTIINTIRTVFDYKLLLEKKKVLITAGPTQESIDPVRYLSNRSSGKMGYALAKASRDFGAHVDLITGPVHLTDIPQVKIYKIITADQMKQKIDKLVATKKYDYIFMAAAVSDFRILNEKKEKIKSEANSMTISLKKNTDIIKNIKRTSKTQIIGFSLETKDGEQEALKKLKTKKLDYIILNYANETGAGFDCNTNHVYIFSKDKHKYEIPLDRKDRVAKKIIEYIV